MPCYRQRSCGALLKAGARKDDNQSTSQEYSTRQAEETSETASQTGERPAAEALPYCRDDGPTRAAKAPHHPRKTLWFQ
ncbi:MAG TPA: hypothetical protein VFU32_08125 [Ktedonobacterales bacterium]|nr:hypothetical protein [Ktedonobacterales bacterium]